VVARRLSQFRDQEGSVYLLPKEGTSHIGGALHRAAWSRKLGMYR
jgi:hypothetical protein